MHAGQLLTYLWVGVVILAVFGNIAKSAKRQAAQLRQRPPGNSGQIPPAVPAGILRQFDPTVAARVVVAPRTPQPVVRQAPPPFVSPKNASPTVAAPERAVAPLAPSPPPREVLSPPAGDLTHAGSRRRNPGWLAQGGWARAVVAAEVLGKPRALRDEW